MKPERRQPAPEEAFVTIRCSHGGKRCAVIAVFHEELDETGARANIALLRDEQWFPDGTARAKAQRFTHTYNAEVVEVSGKQTVWESLIDERGKPVQRPEKDDRDSTSWYWHYTLKCPVCPQNVSARWSKLRPVIAEMLDTGVPSAELSDVNGRLQALK